MEIPNIDRRTRKTKEHLRDSLLSLMKVKSVDEISVREITDLADLNRSTFYLHYENVYDMVEQIEEELFAEFSEIFKKHPSEELNDNPMPMLIDVYRFHGKNADLFTILFSKNGNPVLMNMMDEKIRDMAYKVWVSKSPVVDIQNFEYIYSFISSGFQKLIQNWTENGMIESPEEMAVATLKMISAIF